MSTTTTTHDWSNQLHLPGQAAAPPGPVDMQVAAVGHPPALRRT